MVVSVGCWDAFGADLIARSGVQALVVGGGALALSRYNRASADLLSPEAITDALYAVREKSSLPIIADAADGFGNSLHVISTVRGFEFAGASAVQISDRALRQRDRPGGARFATAEMIGKMKAALDARRHCLIGAVIEVDPEATIRSIADRIEAYLEVGADMVTLRGSGDVLPFRSVSHDLTERGPIGFEWRTDVDQTALRSLEQAGYSLSLHPYLLANILRHGARSELKALASGRGAAPV